MHQSSLIRNVINHCMLRLMRLIRILRTADMLLARSLVRRRMHQIMLEYNMYAKNTVRGENISEDVCFRNGRIRQLNLSAKEIFIADIITPAAMMFHTELYMIYAPILCELIICSCYWLQYFILILCDTHSFHSLARWYTHVCFHKNVPSLNCIPMLRHCGFSV